MAAACCGCQAPWARSASAVPGSSATASDAPAPRAERQASFEQLPAQAPAEQANKLASESLGDEYEHAEPVIDKVSDALDPKRAWASTKSLVGLGPDKKLAETAYNDGETLFRDKKFDDAAKKFDTAQFRWPDSPLEEDALFMRGESYFFADRYTKASDTYANLLKKWPNSRYLDKIVTRQFAIGRYWEDMAREKGSTPNVTDKTRPFWDPNGNAIAEYESIRLHDPTGPLADDAVMATANNYFVRGSWEKAAYNYDLLRKEYPQSEHQAQAHLLGLRAKMRMYQGPQYDGTPLKDSAKLVDQMLVQFPDQLKDERERLLQARASIRAQEAQRDYEMGEYYARIHYYGSARQYYQQVLTNFGDTRFGDMARARIEEYKGRPDVPADHFWWLNKVFGESKKG